MSTIENAMDDIYFLNIEDAYIEALKQNKISDKYGDQRLQYCYYDGPLTDIVLENFIQVPQQNFIEFFSQNHLPIPSCIAARHLETLAFDAMPQDIVDEILRFRADRQVSDYCHADSYFVDPLLALNVAKQKNRVFCGHSTIDGLQVCFYRGELPEHTFENLINVEFDQAIAFFVDTTYRLPEKLEMPDELEEELKAAVKRDFLAILDIAKNQRRDLMSQLAAQAKLTEPTFHDGEPLRLLLPTSRLTTVMQYSSYYVAKEFENRGYRVLLHREDNEMKTNNLVEFLRAYIEFKPHVVFYVNQLNNFFLHDKVTNISWWQDLMPQISADKPLKWRENDFVFSISPLLDKHLQACGANPVIRQHFAVDHEVFHDRGAGDRANKVVFIGSSYLNSVDIANAEQRRVIEQIVELIAGGTVLDEAAINAIAAASPFTAEFVFWKLFHYAVRYYAVKWLCQNTALPVEIYGRHWAEDADVAAHFRGELRHGEAVATVYRSAKYALVCHPFEINSQRLAEAAACGCIPIVYDCRAIAEAPHWDEHCLFFKTRDDLHRLLQNQAQPPRQPSELAEHFTYRAAVDQFIAHSNIDQLKLAKQSHIAAFLGR